MAGPFSAAALAERLGAVVEGDGERLLRGVAGLERAGPDELSFLANRRYLPALRATAAGAVLVGVHEARETGATLLRVANPYLAFAQALSIFSPIDWPQAGVHPSAVLGAGAQVEGATIEALAYVGPGAMVGPGSWVEPGAVIGPGAQVGAACRIMAGAVVAAGCRLGDRVWLNPGAVVGAEGFGFVPTPGGLVKIPQTGGVTVEDDVEIGANTCVDRAAMGETRVGRGARLDNLVQIGHAADIGENSVLVALSGVAGSAQLGSGTVLAARATVLGHLRLGAGVQVGAGSLVTEDVPPGRKVSGTPAVEHGRWLRSAVAVRDLPALLDRVRSLERRVMELERAGPPDDQPAAGAAPPSGAGRDRDR